MGRAGTIDWLVVGLGNPGREHDATRHNIGFVIADALAQRWDLARPKERFRGRIVEGTLPPHDQQGSSGRRPRVAVLWPQTYMNDAGRSVGPAMGSLKLSPEKVVVIHDEIDLPFGEVRCRLGGGLAGHNGLKSVSHAVGSRDFWRVRAGVGRPNSTDPEVVSSWVLGRFREEPSDVQELVEHAADAVEALVQGDQVA